MNFTSAGRPLSDAGMDAVCSLLGIYEAEVWAVLAVETHGFGFLRDRRPRILFERHVFQKRTQGKHASGNEDISNTSRGGYLGGADEYGRLDRAIQLDRDAALMSASWGIGQVMGFNHKSAGHDSVELMVKALVDDEDAQLLAMANFIKDHALDKALQRKNWAAFARGYNGPAFKDNDYDSRLAAAHATYERLLPDIDLRTAQAALLYLGFDPGTIDGVRGRRTESAIGRFQARNGRTETGKLDKNTEEAILAAAFS